MVHTLGMPLARFDALQEELVRRLGTKGISELESGTIVVVPSLSFPPSELKKITGIEFYEHRMLFMLLALRRPDLRIVFVTSVAVDPELVEYHLSFLDDPRDAGLRLQMVTLDDPSPRALTEKLLERPEALAQVRGAAGSRAAYILTFNVTGSERRLSEVLDIPLYGPHPDLAYWGTKSGSRVAAREADVPTVAGKGDVYSVEDALVAIAEIQDVRPRCQAVVLKLNNGFSGQGNAIVELADLRPRLEDSPTTFCAPSETWETYAAKIESAGAVVEELVRAAGMVSPSAQVRIAPGGAYEIVSTMTRSWVVRTIRSTSGAGSRHSRRIGGRYRARRPALPRCSRSEE